MQIRFTKMHGIGNDFVVVDALSQKLKITGEQARLLADRHFGVGCDQVLIVEAPSRPDADFRYRIFNQDGAEVENCGNGARCFAIFVRQRGLTTKKVIRAQTQQGLLTLVVREDGQVSVDMGAPILDPHAIPFDVANRQNTYPLPLSNTSLTIGAVSMGNPHAVTVVEGLADYPVGTVGAEVEAHPQFPNKVNAGFMEIINRREINLRVYERGVGETLACGTGACAAVVSGILQGILDARVSVNLPGGQLRIAWEGETKPVMMTGPACSVFKGQIRI